ncbi:MULTISPECIES: hypothetical protein [Acinetobacter]|uniref:Uncharacterized protein n=1 Tax=Acinetobacter piscicola TaxID=2006115 RepID=A0A7S6VV18_9GAMM|nr:MULTISPECIES: hypothetical protein [Acinetobacter]QOW45330.1 hypothetical protein G0028_05170 [Acinetobacter piscicola]
MSHFQKDQEMNDFSQEYAYALNANGEGAFAIFTSKHQKHSVQSLSRDLFTTVDQVNFDCSDYEPCPTVYIYSKIFQYTSVLPAKIDESEFAKCVHQCAFKSLTK